MITNTGGARDCLPPLWPSLSQSGLNMNLIWNKISKQLFHCYYHNVESYTIFFPSKYFHFFLDFIFCLKKNKQNPNPSDSGLSVFLLHSPKYSKIAADVVCSRDGKSRLCKCCTTANFVDAVQWRHMLGGWQTWKHLKTLTFGSKVQFCSPSKISTILFCRYHAVSCARMVLTSRQQIGCP